MKNLIFSILLIISFNFFGQSNQKYSTYYYQRLSLFESLPNDSNEIIFLGNSISDGCEWYELFGNPKIKNRGISGDVTQGVFDRLDEVIESQPEKIFLMIGVNDLAFGVAFDTIIMTYEKIINKIVSTSPKTKIFIQSILPVNPNFEKFKNHTNKTDDIIRLNKELKKLCSYYNLVYVDLYSSFVDENNYLNIKYTNDGLHLLGEGYLLWIDLIEKYLK